MAAGENKCAACGRFAGRGHKCPDFEPTPAEVAAGMRGAPMPKTYEDRAKVAERVAVAKAAAAAQSVAAERAAVTAKVAERGLAPAGRGDVMRALTAAGIPTAWNNGYGPGPGAAVFPTGDGRAVIYVEPSDDSGSGVGEVRSRTYRVVTALRSAGFEVEPSGPLENGRVEVVGKRTADTKVKVRPDGLIELGYDRQRGGVLVANDDMVYLLTDCCGASAKGSGDATVCRGCYEEVSPSLGMAWTREEWEAAAGPIPRDV